MNLPNQYAADLPTTLPVPPPPRRRQHAIQPPSLLTTCLENTRNAGLTGIGLIQQPPSSTTTSLSSPFSAHPQSAYPASPGGAMLTGASPMNFRPPTALPAAYNPQQWGPMSNTSPQSAPHLPQNSRVVALAPRPVGPDGKPAVSCATYPV